ncbi:MAG TPA: 2-octaprenyl-6-methoxyphenyl hydroxylase [Gammaproteobacteria bacterium]|jgi:2-octaprenyl-6-methoxyphenol hydroxylase|nr:2-octaprenyl-6-methoxyphenyl hydroxylase [Gammaproteobacteria bacterium]
MSGKSAADEYDLLIVGSGLVGASLAAALAPLPLKIAVVEAVSFGSLNQPSFDDRITAVSYGSRRIFESMGIWSKLAPEAGPIRHIHVSDRGRFGVTRLHAEEARVDALGYVVPNRAIGRALGEFIAAQKNIEMLAPAKLESFTLGETGVEAVIEAGGKRSLKAKLLVAADGARSEVRGKLGIAGETVDYAQTAIVCNVRVEHPQAETAFERFADDGPVALLPMGGDRYGFVWVATTADAPAILGLDDAAFRVQAAERFNGRLGRFMESGKRVSYPLSMVRASAQVQGRALIIGNAAHSLHPIAGQGFNLSLRDVAMLAEVLSDARRDGEDLGSSTVLARYVEGRSGDQQGTAVFTDLLNRVFANPLMSVALGRNMGLLALELMPTARRFLMRHNMGLGGRLPKLARGLPLP